MRTAIVLSVALLSLSAQAATTTKLTVNGMVCAFCAQGIEKKLTAMPQTQAVYVDLAEKIVAVEAREGQSIDVDKVRAEVKDAGYDVIKVETVSESVEALRAMAKAVRK
ncbi:heavy-metal-associated domain-containing protein [Methylibium petroleiphilum]|uniref:heavy-metal-associated domain-containing protein n=1 Tax=Methylibium petroleiphilum TaxID=105560 RepID=UPI001AD25D73|nr:heavy metal-associated domain-containing protein [Methylibium petroleiphilum]MBN9204352.1 heavy-metal-associated domain-containing protein [Methylibium petroleiphilum]